MLSNLFNKYRMKNHFNSVSVRFVMYSSRYQRVNETYKQTNRYATANEICTLITAELALRTALGT